MIVWLGIKKNQTVRYNSTFKGHCRLFPGKPVSSRFTDMCVRIKPTFHPHMSGFSKVGQSEYF